jgi:hypothetical protein
MFNAVLGRDVWFTPAPQQSIPRNEDGRCAAKITKVLSPNTVNLIVFDAQGNTHGVQGVNLLPEGQAKPRNGPYCEWPAGTGGEGHFASKSAPAEAVAGRSGS